MKIIEAKDMGNEYCFCVHLDETKLDANGNPDPAYLKYFAWGKQPPSGQTATQYLASIKNEMKLLCQLDLDTLNAGTALAMEGTVL